MQVLILSALLPLALAHGPWDHGNTYGVLAKYNTLPDCKCLGISPKCKLDEAISLLNNLKANKCNTGTKCSTDQNCARRFMELSAWRWGCPYSASAKTQYLAYDTYEAAGCTSCFVNPYNNNQQLYSCTHNVSCSKVQFDTSTPDPEDSLPSTKILYYNELNGNWKNDVKAACGNGANCTAESCKTLLSQYYGTRMACPYEAAAQPPILFDGAMYDIFNMCPSQAQCWVNATITRAYAANVTAKAAPWCGSPATVLARALVGSGAAGLTVAIGGVLALVLATAAF